MSLVYRYRRKSDGDIIYVGITGTKGRSGGIEGLKIRDVEHFSLVGDPIYESEIKPDDVEIEYSDGYTEADARALEILCIAKYNPIYNKQHSNIGGSKIIDGISMKWETYQRTQSFESIIRERNYGVKKSHGVVGGKIAGRILNDDEIELLYDTVLEKGSPETRERDWAIIAIILSTGITGLDCAFLKIGDYKKHSLYIARTQKWIPVGQNVETAIGMYMAVRPQRNTRMDESEFIFRSRRDRRVSEHTIQWFVRKYGEQAGIDNLTVATLRKTYQEWPHAPEIMNKM